MGCASPEVDNSKSFNLLFHYETEKSEQLVESMEVDVKKKFPNAEVNIYRSGQEGGLIKIYCDKKLIMEGHEDSISTKELISKINQAVG